MSDDPRFNEIMPESDDRVLCVEITKPITGDGYAQNFLPRIRQMIDNNGELRLLIYFRNYRGWEREAAEMDMDAISELGSATGRVAHVNPPESVVYKVRVMKPMLGLDIRNFEENELTQALEWVRAA